MHIDIIACLGVVVRASERFERNIRINVDGVNSTNTELVHAVANRGSNSPPNNAGRSS